MEQQFTPAETMARLGLAPAPAGELAAIVSGYDFTRLPWRARGGFGFCLSFILKLLPCPEFSLADGGAAALAAERLITSRLQPEALFILKDNGSLRLGLWLTGFGATMAGRRQKAIELVGREPGLDREGRPKWALPADSPAAHQFEYLGSRREVLNLARRLTSREWAGLPRAGLDVGGGRAGLAFVPEFRPEAQLTAGLSPDVFSGRETVYELLKKNIDPEGLFVPGPETV